MVNGGTHVINQHPLSGAKSKLVVPTIMPERLSLKLGTVSNLRPALEEAGFDVSERAISLLNGSQPDTSQQGAEVVVVIKTVAELGCSEGGAYKCLCESGLRRYYDLCPPDIGAQLCLQQPQHMVAGTFVLAMEPLRDSDGTEETFLFGCDCDGPFFSVGYAYPERRYSSQDRIVFVLPRVWC